MSEPDDDLLAGVRVTTVAEIRQLPEKAQVVHVVDLDDEKFTALARCRELRDIIADGCERLTDSGLSTLERFEHLETLDIEGAERITGRCIDYLIFANKLKLLDIRGCSGLERNDVWRLTSALPNCEVEADVQEDSEHGF